MTWPFSEFGLGLNLNSDTHWSPLSEKGSCEGKILVRLPLCLVTPRGRGFLLHSAGGPMSASEAPSPPVEWRGSNHRSRDYRARWIRRGPRRPRVKCV